MLLGCWKPGSLGRFGTLTRGPPRPHPRAETRLRQGDNGIHSTNIMRPPLGGRRPLLCTGAGAGARRASLSNLLRWPAKNRRARSDPAYTPGCRPRQRPPRLSRALRRGPRFLLRRPHSWLELSAHSASKTSRGIPKPGTGGQTPQRAGISGVSWYGMQSSDEIRSRPPGRS